MKKIILSLSLPLLFASCGGDTIDVETKSVDPEEITNIDLDVIDANSSISTNIGGKIFSIPSPVQMSLFLKNEIGMFNQEMVSDPSQNSNFTTTHRKALNMGVFGADLGYATIFENSTVAVSYLASIEKLSDDLGISGAFDESLMNRFIENGNNQDSMLVIMSDGYRAGDKFLKNNEQHDVATLILTGGWIESLYFATSSFPLKKSQEIANRIGEQKSSLINIIELLEMHNENEYLNTLIDGLKDLRVSFETIKYSYDYVEPETIKDEGLTLIKSTTSVIIDEKAMTEIIEKVKQIRKNIIS